MTQSLQQRLLTSLLAATVATWLAVAAVNFGLARNEVNRIFDAHLIQSAQLLLPLLTNSQRPGTGSTAGMAADEQLEHVERPMRGYPYEKRTVFQLFTENGVLRYRSAGAPAAPLSDEREGFSDKRLGATDWRVYTISDPKSAVVLRVAEDRAARSGLVLDLALKSLLPPLIGALALALWIWRSIGAGLRPLRELARAIRNRDPLRLEPLPVESLPIELVPLVSEINRLLKRLWQVLESERRLTSDAAHELRTPLAGLKTQVQVALRAGDDPARMHALKQLNRGIEDAIHLVEQMLILARMDPESGRHAFDPVDVAALTTEAVHSLEPHARAKALRLHLAPCARIMLPCDPQAISILLRNLIDNAIRYTPADGEVNVAVEPVETGVLFTISDTGPGIPAEEHRRVFERFYRGVGRRTPGSGLGMSIVQRIAELHGGDVQLHAIRPQGLRVEVLIPYPQILDLAKGAATDRPTDPAA